MFLKQLIGSSLTLFPTAAARNVAGGFLHCCTGGDGPETHARTGRIQWNAFAY
jgi:hypothetical protein